MNERVVVDASVAVKWLVNEVASEKALALARFWVRSGIQPTAPYLMPTEVANALYRRVLRGEMSLQAAAMLIDGLLDSGLDIREPVSLHIRAIEMAAQLGQDTIYDTHYLALAELMDCELWTADERFYRAAKLEFRFIRWLREFEDER